MKRIAVLIPAAGAATRYGQCKQLVTVRGKSLLQHAVDLAHTLAPGKVLVVSGAHHREISATVRNAELVFNPQWVEGLGRSIACGVAAAANDYDGILIMLADQIGLDRHDLQRLYAAFDGENIVCAQYQGGRGVPALFCRSSFATLQHLSGERGAKSLLYTTDLPLIEIPMAHAAVDIDVPEDLDNWLRANP